MELIKPSIEVLTPVNAGEMMKRIERAGRTCYKSEDKITEDSAVQFVKAIMSKNHESVIEHEILSVRFICDRGVSHELVRHRLMSFSQESTRYVNYNKRGMTFIIPPWVNINPGIYTPGKHPDIDNNSIDWLNDMLHAEESYNKHIQKGWKPEQARSILPNSLKTEIVVTGNLRNWRHIIDLRTSRAAHPQMREVMNQVYDKFIELGLGVFFEAYTPFR